MIWLDTLKWVICTTIYSLVSGQADLCTTLFFTCWMCLGEPGMPDYTLVWHSLTYPRHSTVYNIVFCLKLYHYGVRDSCLQWLSSYLTGRTQFTKVNNLTSSISKVNSGVPQGSVLGPIFYLIYINDIGHVELKSRVLMFADDSVLIQSHLDPCIAVSNLRQDLELRVILRA